MFDVNEVLAKRPVKPTSFRRKYFLSSSNAFENSFIPANHHYLTDPETPPPSLAKQEPKPEERSHIPFSEFIALVERSLHDLGESVRMAYSKKLYDTVAESWKTRNKDNDNHDALIYC